MRVPATRRVDRRLVRHYLEMVAAMIAGMIVLGPLWPDLPDVLEVEALVMATDMCIAMALWMAVRRHGAAAIAEMSVAMYLPFVVLFAPYRLGLVSAGLAMTLGHLLMLPAMAVAMLHRRDEYVGHSRSETPVPSTSQASA